VVPILRDHVFGPQAHILSAASCDRRIPDRPFRPLASG